MLCSTFETVWFPFAFLCETFLFYNRILHQKRRIKGNAHMGTYAAKEYHCTFAYGVIGKISTDQE